MTHHNFHDCLVEQNKVFAAIDNFSWRYVAFNDILTVEEKRPCIMHYGFLSCLRCKKKNPSPPLAVLPQFRAPSLSKLRHAMFSVDMNAFPPAAPTNPTLSTVNWVPPVSGVVRSTNHPSKTIKQRDFSIMKCASKPWLAKRSVKRGDDFSIIVKKNPNK